MVRGVHKVFEKTAKGKARVTFEVNTKHDLGTNIMIKKKSTLTGGAYYDYNGMEIWLCPVTLFVFWGKYPKVIYFKELKLKTYGI